MSTQYSPKIVTNGLVLSLDAANPKSIISGSTNWTGLSNKTSSGSLFNGTYYTPLSRGTIVFDGADDYVKKSGGFSIKVLIERIRVQLRKLESKNSIQPKNILTVGKLTLDSEQLECLWGNKPLPEKLTTTEFKIIYELAKRPGVLKERAYLMNIAYKNEDSDIEDRTIDSHIKRIRKKRLICFIFVIFLIKFKNKYLIVY